jgi:phosphate transport system substrate-binding protein
MEGLVRVIGDYENGPGSLGYTYQFYLDQLYQDGNVKTIAVDGVAPTRENVRGQAYPFTTRYWGVIRAGEENAPAGRFLDWMTSAEGQACVRQAGYLPIAP